MSRESAGNVIEEEEGKRIKTQATGRSLIPSTTHLVPQCAVEAEVDMEVLVVVVVEDAVRLPRLPPVGLEVDAGVVDDAVVVEVH